MVDVPDTSIRPDMSSPALLIWLPKPHQLAHHYQTRNGTNVLQHKSIIKRLLVCWPWRRDLNDLKMI